MERDAPRAFVTDMAKSKRAGRIFSRHRQQPARQHVRQRLSTRAACRRPRLHADRVGDARVDH
jgi:DNA primase